VKDWKQKQKQKQKQKTESETDVEVEPNTDIDFPAVEMATAVDGAAEPGAKQRERSDTLPNAEALQLALTERLPTQHPDQPSNQTQDQPRQDGSSENSSVDPSTTEPA